MLFLRLAVLIVAAVAIGILLTYRVGNHRVPAPRPTPHRPRTATGRASAPSLPPRAGRRGSVQRPGAHFRSCKDTDASRDETDASRNATDASRKDASGSPQDTTADRKDTAADREETGAALG
ncbi:hypothetical protein [Nocardia wallacei]|uniref:Uncharacterized protein n=1 Tax=Nocardia wallacei TaxID=480035 RepID=A0A7G1KSD3_9NOCA|nr:hypothetical protein [Nocardia wallacei]BCK56859.1 hypothetical protein NWFMUON74_46310 [Nocardia wallacei]